MLTKVFKHIELRKIGVLSELSYCGLNPPHTNLQIKIIWIGNSTDTNMLIKIIWIGDTFPMKSNLDDLF